VGDDVVQLPCDLEALGRRRPTGCLHPRCPLPLGVHRTAAGAVAEPPRHRDPHGVTDHRPRVHAVADHHDARDHQGPDERLPRPRRLEGGADGVHGHEHRRPEDDERDPERDRQQRRGGHRAEHGSRPAPTERQRCDVQGGERAGAGTTGAVVDDTDDEERREQPEPERDEGVPDPVIDAWLRRHGPSITPKGAAVVVLRARSITPIGSIRTSQVPTPVTRASRAARPATAPRATLTPGPGASPGDLPSFGCDPGWERR
jgi:hypothetical protein